MSLIICSSSEKLYKDWFVRVRGWKTHDIGLIKNRIDFNLDLKSSHCIVRNNWVVETNRQRLIIVWKNKKSLFDFISECYKNRKQ